MEGDRCRRPSHRAVRLAPVSLRPICSQKLNSGHWSPYCSFHCCSQQHSRETAEQVYCLRGSGFKASKSMGQPEQIIAKWYEYNCRGLKGSALWHSPQPITTKKEKKKSAARSDCIGRKRVSAAGLRPREFRDLICRCITLTKGFVLCTQQLMTQFWHILTLSNDRRLKPRANVKKKKAISLFIFVTSLKSN